MIFILLNLVFFVRLLIMKDLQRFIRERRRRKKIKIKKANEDVYGGACRSEKGGNATEGWSQIEALALQLLKWFTLWVRKGKTHLGSGTCPPPGAHPNIQQIPLRTEI